MSEHPMAAVMRGISQDIVSGQSHTRLDDLPERERMTITLKYVEGMSFSEIGLVLGVSEFRVSQLHDQAVTRLRPFLMTEAEMLDEASLNEGRASAWGTLSVAIAKAVSK